ncbi:MAG: metallophosphoesterase [Fibrobacteria bacterium]|nr:metallophosphoesterase [Fibrobacteria bacterium]
MILYPALGAPTFVVGESEEGKGGFIHLLLLSKQDLTPAEVNARLHVHRDFDQLRRLEKTTAPAVVAGAGGRRSREPVPNYSQTPKPPDQLCLGDSAIKVEPITGESKKITIPGLELHGYLNPETLDLWRSQDSEGILHLETLYHVSINLGLLAPAAQSSITGHSFFLHWADCGTKYPAQLSRDTYLDYQDQVLQSLLTKERRSAPKAPTFLGKRLVEHLREAAVNHTMGLPGLDPEGLKPDVSVPVTAYHPVYRRPRRTKQPKTDAPRQTREPPKNLQVPVEAMNLGVISDLHLVTKFQILKNNHISLQHDLPASFEHCPLQREPLSPLTDERIYPNEFLPPIGPMISDSVGVLKSHFEDMAKVDPGRSPDAILVVGDLIDFHRDNFPSAKEVLSPPKNRTPETILKHAKAIWSSVRVPAEAFLDSTKERILEPNYQHGTSYLGIHHLIAKFVTTCTKPVFVLAGNHDAYADPFGISPRVAFSDEPDAMEYQKANDGIPCDTNLTMLEAATCFGPSYGNFCRDLNLDPTIFPIFHLLFSPFKTWSLRLGTRQQLAFMHWGEAEEMLTHAEDASGKLLNGHLPHASKAMTDSDVELVTTLAADSPDTTLTLVSHYTYACYAPSVPLFENSDSRSDRGNVGHFPVGDVRNKEKDLAIDGVSMAVGGAAIGAVLGAGVGGIAAGAFAATQTMAESHDLGKAYESGMEGAEDGLLPGAIAGGVMGAAMGLYVVSKGATINTMAIHAGFPNTFNWGTFHHKRKEIFELLNKGSIQGVSLTISGHAHRAAFYTLENSGNENLIQVRGHHFDEFPEIRKKLPGRSGAAGTETHNGALMVVSDSAGPIPRKNIGGLLEGWGSQRPSWTFVGMGADLRPTMLESRFTDVENSKPRLAVVLDYLESTVGHSKHLAPSETMAMLGVKFISRRLGHRPKRDSIRSGPGVLDAISETATANAADAASAAAEAAEKAAKKLTAEYMEYLKDGSDKPLWLAYIPAPPPDPVRTSPAHSLPSAPDTSGIPTIPGQEDANEAATHVQSAVSAYERATHRIKEYQDGYANQKREAPSDGSYQVSPSDEKGWASEPSSVGLFPDDLLGRGSGIMFRTNIFSAFVSSVFSSKSFRNPNGIHLVNHGGAIQLPSGHAIRSILLWMKIKSGKSLKHILFRITPDHLADASGNKTWRLREARNGRGDSSLAAFLKAGESLEFQGLLRYEFTTFLPPSKSQSYEIETPWVVPCSGGIIPISVPDKSFRILFYRDIWACERPDFHKFGIQ